MNLIHNHVSVIHLTDNHVRLGTKNCPYVLFTGTGEACAAEIARLGLLPQVLPEPVAPPRPPPSPEPAPEPAPEPEPLPPTPRQQAAAYFQTLPVEVQAAFGPVFEGVSALTYTSEVILFVEAFPVPEALAEVKAQLLRSLRA